MAIDYERYDKPQVKRWDEVQRGDVVRVEYGTYDNWVTIAILDCVEDACKAWHKTRWVDLNSGREETSYGLNSPAGHDFDVLGRVKNLEDLSSFN